MEKFKEMKLAMMEVLEDVLKLAKVLHQDSNAQEETLHLQPSVLQSVDMALWLDKKNVMMGTKEDVFPIALDLSHKVSRLAMQVKRTSRQPNQ